MPSINLMTLANNAPASITKLTGLVALTSAPLRIENRNGQVHLGVRSWSTYFFEKIVASDLELAQIKTNTQIAIEAHVRAFLNSADTSMAVGQEEFMMNLLHTRTLERSIRRPVFLPSKNHLVAKSENKKSGKTSLNKAADKPFNGAILVQRGVSVAQPSALEQASPELKQKAEWIMGFVDAIFNPLCDKNLRGWIRRTVEAAIKPPIRNSALHVIADVRLVRKETKQSVTTDLLDRGTVVELVYTEAFKGLRSKEAFQEYYRNQLKNVAGVVKSTLLLELPYDSEPVCTDANVYGAMDAAHDFIEKQKSSGKTVSVMIVVPSLPVGKPKSDTGKSPDGVSDSVRQSNRRTGKLQNAQDSGQKNMLEADA